MFEGLVSDLLNKVLGTYIENLDCSKLKISIWGGNVELKDLIIKKSALDDLGLPVQPVYGYLERLTLKIPWSRMYDDAWEAVIEGLLLIVAPNTSIVYDSKKEEQYLNEIKQEKLKKIEEAKETKKSKVAGTVDKQDGFVEKLVAQIVRNIQVQIKSIHIRYEDSVTSPSKPFAAGVILRNLSLQSTDAQWNIGLDTAKLVYKLLTLDGFLIYWCPDASLVSQDIQDADEKKRALKSFIHSTEELKPVLGPINLTTKLQLNTKPEKDEPKYSIPKVVLDVVLEKLSMELSRHQYVNIISLLDSMDRMHLSSKYRKFRPNVNYISGNARLWWIYAFDCKLENIRRMHRNWSWDHMKRHRNNCRLYKSLYKTKLSGAKMSPQQIEDLKQFEWDLDTFNITLARKQAEMEQAREGEVKAKAQQNKGWFGGWLSWGNQESSSSDDSPKDIVEQLEAAMSPEEKQKMFEAIGYSDEGIPDETPPAFVDISLMFLMEELKFQLLDEDLNNEAVCVTSLHKVICTLTKRTSASALKIESSMQRLDVKGLSYGKASLPVVVESLNVSDIVPLLSVTLETNPIDSRCDTRVRVLAQPLNICYHAETVTQALDLFTMPSDVSLQKLQAATLTRLEVVKEKSVSGLQSAIDNHSILDLKVNVKASRLIIPEKGYFDPERSIIVMTLGSINIESKPRMLEEEVNLVQLAATERDQERVLEKMRSSSYDHFYVQLKEIQMVVADKGDDWKNAIASPEATPLHILLPLSLDVEILKCLITNDPNLPKVKVQATLPKIALSIIDQKLIQAAIVMAECFSKESTTPSLSTCKDSCHVMDVNEDTVTDEIALVRLEMTEINTMNQYEPVPQFTEVQLKFTINSMQLDMLRQLPKGPPMTILEMKAQEMSFSITQKTFDLGVTLSLRQISIDHLEWGRQSIISTQFDAREEFLIKIQFDQSNPKSPDLLTIHDSVIQRTEIEMSSLTTKLEQSSLLSLMAFGTKLQNQLLQLSPSPKQESKSVEQKKRKKKNLEADGSSCVGNSKSSALKKKLSLKMGQIDVTVSRGKCNLLSLCVRGLSVDVIMKENNMLINSCLREFNVVDLNRDALHTNMVIMEDGDAWNATIEMFDTNPDDLFDVNKFDCILELEIGTPKIVIINKSILDILSWIDKFQVAKDALASASQAAAKVAKNNLKEAYQQCAKFKYNLVLKAPVIFVPHNATSSQGLLFDLGKIVISNKIELGSNKNELGHFSVFDKVQLGIQEVKISRKLDFYSSEEIPLLQPLSLQLNIVRNLSIGWHRAVPEIEINGNLKAVHMQWSEEDISTVFAILQGNLKETPEFSSADVHSVPEIQAAMSKQEKEQILAEAGKVYKKVSLQFNVESVDLCLFTCDYDSDVLDGDSSRRKSFAKCSLEELKMKVDMLSDSTLTAHLVLVDCNMEDTREDHQIGITKMMEKKTSAGSIPLIDFTFIQRMQNESFGNLCSQEVELKVKSFLLILHLPFLMRLQKFLSYEVTEDMLIEDDDDGEEVAMDMPEVFSEPLHEFGKIPPKKLPNTKVNNESLDSPDDQSLLKIYIEVEEPDIVLVENLNSIDTSCVFLHSEIKSNILMRGSQRNIGASIGSIQMYTCCYNPAKRAQTLSQILSRSELSFNCSSNSSHADHIQVNLGSFDFRLAPDTVELAMCILSCLSRSEVKRETSGSVTKDWLGLWDPKPIDFSALPSLNIETAELAEESFSSSAQVTSVNKNIGKEELRLEFECLLVTLEAGSGLTSIPLIKLQSDCSLKVDGFYSNKVTLDGQCSLELAYFNSRQAIWEPLLEPVEKMDADSTTKHFPLTFYFEGHYLLSDVEDQNCSSVVTSPCSIVSEEFVEIEPPTPLMKLNLSAQDALEFTITKTFLEVLTVLSTSFVEAYSGEISVRHTPKAPYKLRNMTGLTVSVGLKESGLTICSSNDASVEKVVIEPDGEVNLFEAKHRAIHRRQSSLVAECQIALDKFISIKIPSVGASCSVPVTKADKRFFSASQSKEKIGFVTSVSVFHGYKIITLSSCVKVKNELDSEIDIYSMTENGNEVEFVCTLSPSQESLLPLKAIYTPTSELFFSIKGFSVCINPLVWTKLKNSPNAVQELQCQSRQQTNKPSPPFIFCAKCNIEQIFWENTSLRNIYSIMMEISLLPCCTFYNLLPVAIRVVVPGTAEWIVLMPGASLQINHASVGNFLLDIEILSYRNYDWTCSKVISSQPPELSVWTFVQMGTSSDATLDLGMHSINSNGSFNLSLYCPFWMVNKTGFDITYKRTSRNEADQEMAENIDQTESLVHSIEHKKGSNEAVLFSFRSKVFFGKKKANIRLANGEWSNKFPLDTVATSGAVTCRTNDIDHQVSVNIQLSSSGLTKIVTFSAFYKLVNHCPYDLEFCYLDDQTHTWNLLLSGDCQGIWPPGDSQAIAIRVKNTMQQTQPIHFDTQYSALFKLTNKFGGIFVETTLTEGGCLVSLDQCLEGATTALVLNHLRSSSITFWQEGHQDDKTELDPQRMIHFTWDSADSRRLLMLSCLGCDPVPIALNEDKQGTIEDIEVGWATWLLGSQRFVIVSEDPTILQNPSSSHQLERLNQELELSFNSIAIALVNDITKQEVMYLSMASSGIVWEHRKEGGKKYRPFTDFQITMLEKVYLMHTSQSKLDSTVPVSGHYNISSNLEVDFTLMKVLKPFKRHIRRVFQPGVWLQIQGSNSQRNLHMKVNKLQIDNQMSNVMFPVVLARVPPSKSVMAETVPKPFFEMSIVMSMDSPLFNQFKYFRMLVQEFHVKVELPFLYAVLETLFPDQSSDSLYSPENCERDLAIIHQTLKVMVAGQIKPSRRDFYQHLHLSPIKMHLSFSITNLDSASNDAFKGKMIHLFLQSVGVTLTEVQDVIFRLGYFERQNSWMNWEGLQSEVTSHYFSQVIQQIYRVILGLDVIGNPVGLVIGMTKGVGDLFYEPIQGAVEGPGEFAEGLVYGVKSFMGKTVGGTAGAFSRITGTVGKGLASLTFDEEFQRRRREESHKKPADGLESFARGGKGVLTGVMDGVSGVFLKPISGAKEEGVEGFFKGVGIGMVGLVTRPASGVVDFASGSLDAVMRATDSTEEISPVRPPRFISNDGVIRPYDYRSAMGTKILKEMEKGQICKTDSYVIHSLIKGGRSILFGTDQRVMMVSKNDLLGQWKIDWMHFYDELSEVPLMSGGSVRLTVKVAKKKVLGLFGGGDNSKEIPLNDINETKLVVEKLAEAFNNGKLRRPSEST